METAYTFSGIVREVVEILDTPKVIDYLDALPQPLHYEIDDTLDYITTFGQPSGPPGRTKDRPAHRLPKRAGTR